MGRMILMNMETKNRNWVQCLSTFPFEVERIDDVEEYALSEQYTENGAFRLDHTFNMISIDDLDDVYGLILKCREDRHIGYVPLLDLGLKDKKYRNKQFIDEFLEWYSDNHG